MGCILTEGARVSTDLHMAESGSNKHKKLSCRRKSCVEKCIIGICINNGTVLTCSSLTDLEIQYAQKKIKNKKNNKLITIILDSHNSAKKNKVSGYRKHNP